MDGVISRLLKSAPIIVIGLIALWLLWPFNSVPTGSRGVVTQFGRNRQHERHPTGGHQPDRPI